MSKVEIGFIAVLVGLIVLIGAAIAWGANSSNAYNKAHPLVCISEQKVVNNMANRTDGKIVDRTLTFENGQVLQQSQLMGNQDLSLGKTVCTAYARQ